MDWANVDYSDWSYDPFAPENQVDPMAGSGETNPNAGVDWETSGCQDNESKADPWMNIPCSWYWDN